MILGMILKKRFGGVVLLSLLSAGTVNAGGVTESVNLVDTAVAKDDSSVEATVKYSFWTGVDFAEGVGGYDFQTVSLEGPVLGNRGDGFSWSVHFEGEYTYFNSLRQPVVGDHDLYEVGFTASLLWNNIRGSKWSPVIILKPSIASDFDNINSDAFRLTAFAGAIYQQSSNFKWFVGAAYNDVGHQDHVFPVAGFSWQPNEFLDFTLLGPRLDLKYKHSADWHFGVFADVHSSSWDLTNNGAQQTLSLFSARAGVRVDYQAFENRWVFVEAGATFSNSLEVNDRNDNELLNDNADSGFFSNVGMRFEF